MLSSVIDANIRLSYVLRPPMPAIAQCNHCVQLVHQISRSIAPYMPFYSYNVIPFLQVSEYIIENYRNIPYPLSTLSTYIYNNNNNIDKRLLYKDILL